VKENVMNACWSPAIAHAPELLNQLECVGSVAYAGSVIRLYRHTTTGEFLSLDGEGQAWRVTVNPGGGIGAARISLADAKAAVLQQKAPVVL
jgi:hypothetical protein